MEKSKLKAVDLNTKWQSQDDVIAALSAQKEARNHVYVPNATKEGSDFMVLPQERFYTIDDIYALPEGVRAELIDRQIYYMAAPSRIHQKISMFLCTNINNYIQSKKSSCEVYSAPFAVFLNKDDKTYLEPDISVICDPGKLNDKGCNGAPDWIIEITSPSNPTYDYIRKLNLYLLSGAREYWIVNPKNQVITVYYFADDNLYPRNYTFKDKIKVNIYDDLVIDFNELNI